jgi:hypothetical protein
MTAFPYENSSHCRLSGSSQCIYICIFFCTPKQGRQKTKFKEDKKQIFMLVKGQIKNLKNISQK